MKRIIIFFATILGVGTLSLTTAQAQFADKLIPHVGYMYSILNIKGTDATEAASASYVFNTISIGTYYTLAHHNDWVSVGVDPSLGVGLNFRNAENRINWVAQAPVFVMGRIGANSTKYNTQKIGMGIGIGGTASYMNYKLYNGELDMKPFFINPAAVGELTLNMRGSTLTGRVQFSLAPATQEADLISPDGGFLLQDREAKFGNIGLGLIYGF